jgi:hypothetical protein
VEHSKPGLGLAAVVAPLEVGKDTSPTPQFSSRWIDFLIHANIMTTMCVREGAANKIQQTIHMYAVELGKLVEILKLVNPHQLHLLLQIVTFTLWQCAPFYYFTLSNARQFYSSGGGCKWIGSSFLLVADQRLSLQIWL